MTPFQRLEGIAAPLPVENVDTDALIAVQHLYTLKKTGLGRFLLHRWRYTQDGREDPGFVLNRAEFKGASILVARANFGCGSSREHAVWALADYGFRCIVAPSFASILYENCINNGILPVVLPPERVEDLLALLEQGREKLVSVDLPSCSITFPDGTAAAFTINPAHRQALLEGMDPIGSAMRYQEAIATFQREDRNLRPWVWERHDQANP
jgi:3-isopropylmalate/(R)-2-methylmalate dehydratase small subunit